MKRKNDERVKVLLRTVTVLLAFVAAGVLADLDPPKFGPPGPNSLADLDPPLANMDPRGLSQSASGFGHPYARFGPPM